MIAVLPRHGSSARAGLVVLVGTLLVSAVLVTVPIEHAVAALEGNANPAVVTFGVMTPGELQHRDVTLTAPPGVDADVLRIRTTGTGSLLASVATGVSSCAVPWSDGACATGERPLTDGSAAVPVDRAVKVPIPDDGKLYLLVSLELADDAPEASSAEVTYTLSLTQRDGDDLATTGADVSAAAAAAAALVGLGWSLRAWVRHRRVAQ